MINRGNQLRLFFNGTLEPGNINCKYSQSAVGCS
jgi:hypothetical protein